jgi:Undecaprenyl-phosphate glucose phosphotransferase
MFRIRTYLTNASLVCFDLTITALCHIAVWRGELIGILGPAPPRNLFDANRSLALGVVLILWIVLSTYFRLYHSRRLDSPFADAVTLFKVGLASWIALEGSAQLLPQLAPTSLFLLRFEAINTLTLVAARLALRLLVRQLRRRGKNVKNLVLVASPELGNRVAQKIEQRAHLGYRIVRQYSCIGVDSEEAPRLVKELQNTLSSMAVEDVVIALPADAHNLTAQLARECESRGINVRIVPDLFPLIQSDTQVYDLDGIPLINVRLYPAEYFRYAVLKRIFDVCASLAVLILFSPLYALIAIFVKLSSPGPVHFVQERVSLNGKKFKMLKFRTMRMDLNPDTHWTVPNDPHVTAVGRCLRRSNLDEIPQFLNVLKGDMSIVGPRPERPVFLERFRRQVPEYMARHYVKSGITGWAQVNGWRGDTSISQRIACDLYYIRNWAFGLDLKIVFLTVLRTFFHRNAY